jgi:hypothetical protein
MTSPTRVALIAAIVVACGRAETHPPAGDAAAAPGQDARADRIALAMSAAPVAVSGAATIIDFDADGEVVELRAGTNGWLCLPDDPATPGDDPMCLDAVWQEWVGAHGNRTPPSTSRLGIAYMLRGGAAASNDDAFATEPPAGQAWIHDGPHLMLLVPDPDRLLQGITRDHASGQPYVMWGGTDYAHVMVPINSH